MQPEPEAVPPRPGRESLRGRTISATSARVAARIVATPDFGGETYDDSDPHRQRQKRWGLLVYVFPRLYREDDIPATPLAEIGAWAAGLSVPAYAIDDQTAVKVADGAAEVVSEGRWKLFTPSLEANWSLAVRSPSLGQTDRAAQRDPSRRFRVVRAGQDGQCTPTRRLRAAAARASPRHGRPRRRRVRRTTATTGSWPPAAR